jgi:hypothetical protein
MGMGKVEAANAKLFSDWNEARAEVQKQQKPKTEREKAMETFAEAMRDCDKAIENIVDKHHETVAKSAKKQAEYRKELARQEQIQRRMDEQRLFHEEALISQLNLRNMLKEDRFEEMERREQFAALG